LQVRSWFVRQRPDFALDLATERTYNSTYITPLHRRCDAAPAHRKATVGQ